MSPQDHNEILDSWKSIAAHFNVTPRTVQLWEAERGLPVRRHPGGRGRVFAYKAELDAWRNSAPAELPPAPPPPPPPPRWPWFAMAAVAILTATLSFFLPKLNRGRPSDYRISGQSLIVVDEAGSVLWTRRFEVPISENFRRDPTTKGPALLDVDADGNTELLFPLNSAEINSSHNGALYCFSSTGDPRWVFRNTRTVRTTREVMAPPYLVRYFALVPGPAPRLLVVTTNVMSHASQAALLDSNGQLLRQYWHSGHLGPALVTDLVPGGGPEIYLGGVSNSHNQATLVALDPDSLDGAALEPDPGYQIQGFNPPREIARLLLPRSFVNRTLDVFNHVDTLTRSGGHLVANVSEFSDPPAVVAYSFNPQLELAGVGFNSYSFAAYRQLHAQGKLPAADPNAELPALRKLTWLTPAPPSPPARQSGSQTAP